MTTQEFITALRKTPDHRLIFENEAGDRVPPGYHLTEIKAAHFDTVDCGGQTNRWDETIVQLWVPEGADDSDEYMTAGKFLRIFDKVTAMIPLNLKAEVRIEYGDQNIFPSLYHVESVIGDGAARVLLAPPATTCKGRDRRLAEVEAEAGACCETACC